MASSFNLKFMTPSKKLWDGQINKLLVRAITGDMEILANHMAIVTSLEISVVKIFADNEWHRFTIDGGYLQFIDNEATLLSNIGENVKDLNVSEIEMKVNKDRKLLEQAQASDESLINMQEFELKKQLNRLSATREK